MQQNYSDQSKIFNQETWGWPIHLIGAGGINNLVGPILAKMGVSELHVWDDDRLETRNCPSEVAYSYNMVGQLKTAAMADMIYHLMPNSVEFHQHVERVTPETNLEGVVISGVDSMKGRREIWQCVQANFLHVPLYIDARSAGEEIAIFAFSPSNMKDAKIYQEDWLYSDEEGLKLECGARNIGYISAYMAAEISRIITRFHRDLPFNFYTARDFANENIATTPTVSK